MKRMLILVAMLCGFGTAGAADPNSEITAATTEFMQKEMGVSDSVVRVEKVDGNYARVQVNSAKDKLDPAIGFLQLSKDGVWEVMVIGTGFTPSDYQEMGIPESIQPPPAK